MGRERGSLVDINFGAPVPLDLGEEVPVGTGSADESSICWKFKPGFEGEVGGVGCSAEGESISVEIPGFGSFVDILKTGLMSGEDSDDSRRVAEVGIST